jgi:hypothetical protein
MTKNRTFSLAAVLLVGGLLVTAPATQGRPLASFQPAVADADCSPGTLPERDVSLAAFADGLTQTCAPASRPESRDEMLAMNAQLAARRNGGYPVRAGALEAAVAQHEAISRSAPASTASWIPVGRGPLNADVAAYPNTNGVGFHQLAGRIEDLAYDASNPRRWFAAFAGGGVWETTNAGAAWHSIGEALPTQAVGAVAYLETGVTGTLLAGTGDPAYGTSAFGGLGVYRSTNGGRSWVKSTGVPAGTLSFSFGYDPHRPTVVYAATSKGLYRSSDAGRSFRNVGLPTTCADVRKPICFFANMVTDVVVRPSNRDGTGGGAVLAAVGWRAGRLTNAVGKPQSPQNGLYASPSGAAGSFRFVSNPAGFAPDHVVGRTALGVAVGARQNHDYVYALVQDALKFNEGATVLDQPEPTNQVPNNTVLNALYGSTDFGKNWTKLADAAQLQAPGSGTALTGAFATSFAPGVQAWYNEWISVDPTSQDEAGVPGRIAFGLEEVWTGSGAVLPVPNTGRFTVVGRYFSGSACGGASVPALQGYCPFAADPTKPLGSTTHPDQHAGLWVPSGNGGVTLVVGNDGGAYKQTLKAGEQLTNDGWGNGSQNGFNTLMPYAVAMSSDGTVVMGLQDNGSAVITPEGKQIMAFGGDGFHVAIDPDDSNVWWSEHVHGDLRATTNGGKTWTSKRPSALPGALFSMPIGMDATNADHLVVGGRQLFETTKGTAVAPDTWKQVFDLGTRTQPGRADAPGDEWNLLTAVDTRGDGTYAAYCGQCDITAGVPFGSGLATNVGGADAPQSGTSSGWHIAKAAGLPKRYINSVRIDPKNARIVYVTLGGYGRRWIPPGSLGDDVSKVGTGHVFRSTDAGASFTDISRNLPDIGADDAFPFNGGLVVATDLGVYFAPSASGGGYRLLGTNLPHVAVMRLSRSPRNPSELVAAAYGRGVYRIVVAGGKMTRAPSGAGTGTGAPAARSTTVAPVPSGAGDESGAGRLRTSASRQVLSDSTPLWLLGLLLIAAFASRRPRRWGRSR